MCAGAIVNSRIDRVVFGAYDMQAGCCGSVINFNAYPFNHAFQITGGILEDECKKILTDFFKNKRK
jgi:tRNA(adenine34) deaminase